MGVDKSIIGRIFSKPLLWFATRPPEKGAKTPIFALLSPGITISSCLVRWKCISGFLKPYQVYVKITNMNETSLNVHNTYHGKFHNSGNRRPYFCYLKYVSILDLTETTGKLFSNMEEMAIEEVAKDRILAKKLFLIDEYWTGLKTKEEIKTSW